MADVNPTLSVTLNVNRLNNQKGKIVRLDLKKT